MNEYCSIVFEEIHVLLGHFHLIFCSHQTQDVFSVELVSLQFLKLLGSEVV